MGVLRPPCLPFRELQVVPLRWQAPTVLPILSCTPLRTGLTRSCIYANVSPFEVDGVMMKART